jgi:hypothetical protein
MQPVKPYKFLQEQIFDGIWLFNKLRSPLNILLLTLFYFIWGLALFFIYNIPQNFLIAGISGAFGISLWTYGIIRYADQLRETQIEKLNKVNKKFLVRYLDDLFHPASIVIGVVLYTITSMIFLSPFPFSEDNFITKIKLDLGFNYLPPILLIYIFFITFDICYRLGLSAYIILIQTKRNYDLNKTLSNSHLKPFFSPKNVKTMKKADKYHYLALSGGIFIIPLIIREPVLMASLIIYLGITFLLTTINLLYLGILYNRAIPRNVLNLLGSSKFAFIGTSSQNRKPHVTPTLFVFDGRHIFLTTSIKSLKIKNLRKMKNIAICIEHRKIGDLTKSHGVMIQGNARIYGLILGLRMLLIRNLFSRKYPQYLRQYAKKNKFLPRQWRTIPIFSRTLVEVIPDRFVYWKGTRFSSIKF